MPRHPSHDPDPATYQCRTCGMTNEEQMDYDAIECNDARAAVMPSVVTPIPDHFSERSRKLNELWRRQRGLMIECLWALARRRQQSMERVRRHEAGEQPPAAVRTDLPPAAVATLARHIGKSLDDAADLGMRLLADLRAAGWVVAHPNLGLKQAQALKENAPMDKQYAPVDYADSELRRQALDMAIRCGDPATAVERAGQFLVFLKHDVAPSLVVEVVNEVLNKAKHPEKRWPKMGDIVIYCAQGFEPAPAIVTHPIWSVDGDGDRKISLYVVGTAAVFPVLSVPRGDWRFRDE